MKEENLGISETFIARQSIVDEFMDIFGYEFFFREGLYPYARIKEPNEATVKLIEIMLKL
ncbi:hypothetical protein [Sulfurihydrogenibium sp.]|uniref:hypothetical protein n=1 Tax=Sulfurihydrogenibium sp. TaxID=2053621 RepID=UPI0026356E6B|nr:hypothetical protein [Sulfurihydrogenibium sp.]